MIKSQGVRYIITFSYSKNTYNKILTLPLDLTWKEVKKIELISLHCTLIPSTITPIQHSIILNCDITPSINIISEDNIGTTSREFSRLLLRSTHPFMLNPGMNDYHNFDPQVSDLKFWLTYNDNTSLVLAPADSNFEFNAIIEIA